VNEFSKIDETVGCENCLYFREGENWEGECLHQNYFLMPDAAAVDKMIEQGWEFSADRDCPGYCNPDEGIVGIPNVFEGADIEALLL